MDYSVIRRTSMNEKEKCKRIVKYAKIKMTTFIER